MRATLPLLRQTDFPALQRDQLKTLQVNLGYRCNQSCLHCHVNAGPKRSEEMSRETVEVVLNYLDDSSITTLDITGGAPELNQHFRYLVETAHKLGAEVIDRCNLTILNEPGQEDLVDFLAAHQVQVVASLPCYLEENVDRQRGEGVFDGSMTALRKLNAAGYGKEESGLVMNLVYNPAGPDLPPSQAQLENDYKQSLAKRGIFFNQLLTLTNMPIKRFGSTLISKGQFQEYMQLLKDNFVACNLSSVMCRTLISVDWQGYVYDCDFNQMLDLVLPMKRIPRPHLRDLFGVDLSANPIAIADHCYGCTAGQGSSCGGALAAE